MSRRPLCQRLRRFLGSRLAALSGRLRTVRGAAADAGMSTAEYAVGLLAACAFAALLYKILTSSTVESLLRGLITRALHVTL
jgi:hypothetical protein